MKKEISLKHKIEMTDGKITSEWLVLNDESVPMSSIPVRISVHPDDVTELIEKLSIWQKQPPLTNDKE